MAWAPRFQWRPRVSARLDLAVLAEADAEARARLLEFAAGDRVGTIVGGIERRRAMVARQPDPAERRRRARAVGRPIPVDDAGAAVGPESAVFVRAAADQRSRQAEAGVVRLGDRLVEA